MIFKPADELARDKATFTAGNAWFTETHPPVGFVTDHSEIRGTFRNPHFKNNGIYCDFSKTYAANPSCIDLIEMKQKLEG